MDTDEQFLDINQLYNLASAEIETVSRPSIQNTTSDEQHPYAPLQHSNLERNANKQSFAKQNSSYSSSLG